MKLVMTVMVRDEADVIERMLDHHIQQGVDRFVITDNGSVDGTREILEEYAVRGLVDLRHDPVHRKQQGETVTRMARDAYTVHGATWVLNADADEFWFPVDRSLKLKTAFEHIPADIGAFVVPVIDMTGAPAARGAGLDRLRFRDRRSVAALNEIGLHAHSTGNTVHVGSPEVVVAQGNHFVDIESTGEPPAAFAIEVLHLPWRSWSQFRRKVENAGRAYENAEDLLPSPNHHGMREWRRLQEGSLYAWYVARHPTAQELEQGLVDGVFVEDLSLVTDGDRAVSGDSQVDVGEMRAIVSLLTAVTRSNERLSAEQESSLRALADRNREIATLTGERDAARTDAAGLLDNLRVMGDRRAVRVADRVGHTIRRLGAARLRGRR